MTLSRNLSQINEPLLTFPFQAVITITKQSPTETTAKIQQKDYLAVRDGDLSDVFPPYFEKNYTITNESGQVNVILDDLIVGTNKKKIKKKNEEEEEDNEGKKEEEEEEEKENQQNIREQKKKNEKKKKGSAKQQKSNKRQPFVFGDLLRMLGVLRKLPKNTTEINVATPVLSILKGTNQQKIRVTLEDVSSLLAIFNVYIEKYILHTSKYYLFI